MKKALKLINNILLYSFFVIGVITMFLSPESLTVIFTAFGSFISSCAIVWLLKRRGINDKYFILINAALWLNLAGELRAYYVGGILMHYDKFIHLVVPFMMAAIVYEYLSYIGKSRKEVTFYSVMGMLALWEIFEFFRLMFFGETLVGVIANGVYVQSPYDDTLLDMVFGMFGTLSYLFFKKEKVDVALKKDVRKIKIVGRKAKNKIHMTFSTFLRKFLVQ